MATVFTAGVSHKHKPCGKWADIQAAPNSGFVLNHLCPNMTPIQLVRTAMIAKFIDKPIALTHLDWYLVTGKGLDFKEDANIKDMMERDTGVQAAIAALIPPGRTTGKFASNLKIEQSDYAVEDFQFAFGAIDRLDFEVDFGAKTIHVWFQDFYEWHPYYPGLYSAFSDDGARETNCLHAALVELKLTGAADYWMKGEATVPLSLVSSVFGRLSEGCF